MSETRPKTPTRGVDPAWIMWAVRTVALAAVIVVAWAAITGWGAIVHGFPLYGPLLVVTLLGALIIGLRTLRRRRTRVGWRRIARAALIAGAIGWISLIGWLRPFSAVEPALAAMTSDGSVQVTDSATQIVMAPTGSAKDVGVFFQPGAKVEARAYAAVLRPLAEAGYTVVIPKQPLGIAFLAVPAFDSAKPEFPKIDRWVVGGHSLGGTVAAMEADSGDTDQRAPVVGLLFYASYPAGDISTSLDAKVLSISGSRDGLATPAKVDASKTDLPAGSEFTVIKGGVHAFFGDYGPQPGDGTPAVSHDRARAEISKDSVDFVAGLAK